MLLDISCCKWSQQNTAVGESVKVILDFLNDVCPLHKISYWSYASKGKRKCDRAAKSRATNSISKWSSRETLYICLLRLRTGFTIKTLSVLLSTPDKPIKGTAVLDIFTTFIQLMYKIFREMEDVMFPTRETLPFSTINSRIEEMVISAGDTVIDTSDQLLTFATLF